jgi:tellurite methyltransferase
MPHELPDGLELVRTTKVFDDATVPKGLLSEHRIADDVWGRLVVHTGALQLVFDDDPGRPRRVQSGGSTVIPPGRLHHVVLTGPCTFAIEFHRPA